MSHLNIKVRKPILIVILLLIVVCITFYYFKYIYGWKEFRKNTDTPEEFLNPTVVKKDDYTKDSIALIKQLKLLLLKREDFFHDKAYYDSTQLIIDTILYSPDLNKLATFVITKNPTSRQLSPDRSYEWYYDATCYLGVRKNDTISLSWLGPVFTNSYSKEKISNHIRTACFRTFVTKDTVGAHTYKYNLNDIRFWDSPTWKEIEEEKIKKKKFEEEKKNHPENIYEPPKHK